MPGPEPGTSCRAPALEHPRPAAETRALGNSFSHCAQASQSSESHLRGALDTHTGVFRHLVENLY